jgi:hypothetical protein
MVLQFLKKNHILYKTERNAMRTLRREPLTNPFVNKIIGFVSCLLFKNLSHKLADTLLFIFNRTGSKSEFANRVLILNLVFTKY